MTWPREEFYFCIPGQARTSISIMSFDVLQVTCMYVPEM